MPFGNGDTGTQRKHGVPAARLPLSGWCLLCSLLCGGLAAARTPPAPSCQPCAADCTCAGGRPGAACMANCSARGLERPPGVPTAATALDLSRNKISALDVQMFRSLTSLAKLDISHNKISTLEEGIFDNLFNLSEMPPWCYLSSSLQLLLPHPPAPPAVVFRLSPVSSSGCVLLLDPVGAT